MTADEFPQKAAFYRNAAGQEIPCDSVRFAVGDETSGIVSAIWTAACSKTRKSTDMLMTTEGLGADAKVTFHAQDAIVAYRQERLSSLFERGIFSAGQKRQTESVPILDEPFLVASIAFFPGAMKRPDRWRRPPGKPMTVIKAPPMDQFLRVHVVHSYDGPVAFEDHVSGDTLYWFARLQCGNRHLTFFHIAYAVDWATEKQKLQHYVEQIPPREDLLDLARAKNLSAVFWGSDETHLNFFEIHTLGVKPPVSHQD